MMDEPKYKRVLLKISGEALAGDKHFGLDFQVMGQVADVIRECVAMGVQVGVVIGGGNFWRGVKNGEGKMARSRADHMGMLATVMNCLAVSDVHGAEGHPRACADGRRNVDICRALYPGQRAIAHLEEGKVVLFGCGQRLPVSFRPTRRRCCARPRSARTRSCLPRTSTASTVPIRHVDPSAVKYDAITYDEVLAKHLAVMDLHGDQSLAMDNDIPVRRLRAELIRRISSVP